MATVEGTDGPNTLGGRSGVTQSSDTIYGYGGPDKIYGLGGDDVIFGGDGKDEVYGGDGHDYLFGDDGDDTLNGEADNDTLHGGAGADILDGGSEFDIADYYTSPSGVFVNLMAGKGWGGDAAGDQFISIEAVYGSQHDDTVFGDDNGNTVWASDGRDTIKGFGGDDHIHGHDGADTLYGMDGDDLLSGGTGKDFIHGGAGQDSLLGDEGGDTFVWSSTDEAAVDGLSYGSCNTDVIDFRADEFDLIDLHAIDADVYAPGNQAFVFIGDAAFSGNPGELAYTHFGGNTFILMQTGTTPDVEGVIRIPGIVTPNANWFEL